MKNVTYLLIALGVFIFSACLAGRVQAAGAAESEVHYIVADENDRAEFTTIGDSDRYLLMGFNSTPIVMDVTDEEDPFLLYGYEEFDMNDEVGAYLAYPGQAVCVAVGFDTVVEIDAIDMN